MSFVCDSVQIPTYESKQFLVMSIRHVVKCIFHFVIVVLYSYIPFFRCVKGRRGRGLLVVFINKPIITVLVNSEQNQELFFFD